VITGFWDPFTKLFGPVHAYVELPTVLAERLISFPTQTGVLLVAEGAEGVGITVTEVVPGEVGGHPGMVAVTE
jgi:hypothetical protein